MIKRLLRKFFGTKFSFTPNNPSDDPPRIEVILTDGFVYVYPYTVNGTTYKVDNIKRAAKFINSAKTKKKRKDRGKLIKEVSDLEAKLVMDSIDIKIEKKVKDSHLKKRK